jgi:hypothetical protein
MIERGRSGMMRSLLVLAILAAVAVLGVASAVADEAKTPVSATMFLSIMSAPLEARDVAFDRSLKEDGPVQRSMQGEVLADGSVKYGRTIITVRNPCPPGTTHYEPPPLPGRRARN